MEIRYFNLYNLNSDGHRYLSVQLVVAYKSTKIPIPITDYII